MIIDKYSFKYDAEDLRREWEFKSRAFREVLKDLPEFSVVINALIILSDHIFNSASSSWLFPGTGPDKLVIMPVKNQEIQSRISLDIRTSNEGKEPFIVSLRRDWNSRIEWEIRCGKDELINAFESNIGLLRADNNGDEA